VPENKLNLLSYLQSNPLQMNMSKKGMQNKPFNTFVFFIAYFASLFLKFYNKKYLIYTNQTPNFP